MKTSFKWNKPIPAIAKEATGGKRTLLFMRNCLPRRKVPICGDCWSKRQCISYNLTAGAGIRGDCRVAE